MKTQNMKDRNINLSKLTIYKKLNFTKTHGKHESLNTQTNAGFPKLGPGGPLSLQSLAPTLIKHTCGFSDSEDLD